MIAVISWRKIAPDKKGAWQKTSLAAGGDGVIGRARSSLICLEDIRVSRKHVSVAIKNGAVHITDHGSANGAFLDGQSFESSVWSPGQRLQIADFEFQLEIDQGQPRAKTVSRGGHPIGGGVDDDAYAAAQALIAEARRGGVPLGGVAAVTPEAVAPQAAAVRSPTRPSQRMKLNRVPALVPMGWLVQVLMLLGIVVTSVVMTVRVILLSVATKTSAVESKAKEALSIFGIDLSKVLDENSDVTESFSNAVDPWSFAWDMDAYRGLVVASIVIYAACFAAFVIWHYLVDRAIPFRQSRGIFSRVLNGPLVWFVPVANLIQPPRVIGRVYGFA
ncbi:MAG: FHA domain-containing protein, partial [Pseudomonadota bacterium]